MFAPFHWLSEGHRSLKATISGVTGERLQAGKEDLAAAVEANVQYSKVQEDED